MEQTDQTATDNTERQTHTGELIRPVAGRMLAGVSKGIADNFGISEWIPRVFFIVTAFMGGFGLALYAAGWAFIRSEDEPESPAERFFSGASSSRAWIGIGLIVIAAIVILSNFTILSGEVVWAGALLAVGLLLYLGYFPSGSKKAEVIESKEGVQQMTTTDTTTRNMVEGPSGDSPAGGSTTPPAVPTPTPPDLPPAKPKEHSILGRLTLGVMAIGLGVLALLDNIQGVPIDPEPYHYLALAVTILGAGLLVGSILGRARWLILVGLILVPTLMFSSIWEWNLDSRDFDLRTTPLTFAEVGGDYGIDVGNLQIDLTELPWDGEEISIDAGVDAGNMVIVLPDGVGIVGTATVDIGRVSEAGRSSSGLGDPHLDWDEPGEDGTVFLDAHVDMGNIEIQRRG